VDDGSTDNTKELVDGWVEEQRIAIRYFYQENAGKMMAHNKAVCEAKAELFMCVDSDDKLCSETVVKDCLDFWDCNKTSGKNACGFMAFKRMSNERDTGEKAYIFLRHVLEKYPFPYFMGEKFVTDVYIYDQIVRDYEILEFPYDVQECKYNNDGYSYNYMKVLFDNPQGFRAYHNQCVRFRKKGYWKSAVCYVALSIRVKDWRMLSTAANVPLTILSLPLGVVKYFYDNYRLSRL